MRILKAILIIWAIAATVFVCFVLSRRKNEEYVFSVAHPSSQVALGPVGTWKFNTNGMVLYPALPEATLKEILQTLSKLPMDTTNIEKVVVRGTIVEVYEEGSKTNRRRIILMRDDEGKWRVSGVVPIAVDSFEKAKNANE